MTNRKLPVWSVSMFVLLCLLAISQPASGADKLSPATRPGDKAIADARAVLRRFDPITPEEKLLIEKLIRDLGDRKWKVRQKATEGLLKIRSEAFPLVRQAAKSKDPEVATRLRLVVKTLQEKAGNLGIDLDIAVNTLSAARDRKVVSMLIGLLGHTNPTVRYTSEYGLRRVTGKNFGYNSRNDPEQRAGAIGKWRQWWKQNEAGFDFRKPAPESFGLLICDDLGGTLTAVSPKGKVAWSRKLPTKAICAAGLPNGNVIVGYRNGQIIEYDRDFKEVWKYTKIKSDILDISLKNNGNILITVYAHNRILEVNRAGKVVWEKCDFARSYSASQLPNGNILVSDVTCGSVSEYSRGGEEVVWQKKGLRSPYDAVKLPSGNVLIAEYGRRQIAEVNIAGKVVWQMGCPALPSSLCSLPDGTIVVRLWGKGVVLLTGRNRRTLRQLVKDKGRIGKVRVVPAAVLEPKQSATSSQPSAKPKK